MNDDLISRQAAIDAFESIGSLDTNADREYARSIFETLPSAQPEIEPKTGRWIPIKPLLTAARCSECKSAFTERTNYCPHCGAKMEGEADEQ